MVLFSHHSRPKKRYSNPPMLSLALLTSCSASIPGLRVGEQLLRLTGRRFGSRCSFVRQQLRCHPLSWSLKSTSRSSITSSDLGSLVHCLWRKLRPGTMPSCSGGTSTFTSTRWILPRRPVLFCVSRSPSCPQYKVISNPRPERMLLPGSILQASLRLFFPLRHPLRHAKARTHHQSPRVVAAQLALTTR